MPRVILDWDPKYKKAKIASEFLDSIRAKISVPNDKKNILRKRGISSWRIADFTSPITSTGRFDIGLYFEIKKILKEDKDVDYEIITTDILQDKIIQTYLWNNEYDIAKLSMELRPYQETAVKKCIYMGYGICVVGTAGGKTLLMASLIETIRDNQKPFTTIVMLPANLVEQTYKEFTNYNIKSKYLSMWNGDNEFKKTDIILASAETMRSNLIIFSELKPKPQYKWKAKNDETYDEYIKDFGKKEKERKKNWTIKRKYLLEQLKDVDLMLVDEVHGLRKDNAINNVLSLFDTRHKFGFTGTMPPGLLDQWNIIGQIGPILVDINSAELRSMNYVSQVKAQIVELHYKNKPELNINFNSPTEAYNTECEFLFHNDFRNKVITKLASSFDKNALIMVDKIEHGETLENQIKQNTDKKVYFVRGSVVTEERERIRELMEKQNDIICVAMSRIFAVGINIKNLHYVLFAQGGKAKVTLIQSIGRGLRLHEQKECLVIFDIADTTHYGQKHLQERIKYYEDEQIKYEKKNIFE